MLQNTGITTVQQLFEAGSNGYNVYIKENGEIVAFLESLHPSRKALPHFKNNPQELRDTFVSFFSSAIEDVFAYSYEEAITQYLTEHFSSHSFLKPFDIDSIHFLVKKSFAKVKAHYIKNLFSVFPQFIYKPHDSFHIAEYLSRFSKEDIAHIATTENIHTILTQHNQGNEIYSAKEFLQNVHLFFGSTALPPLEKVSPAPHIVEQHKQNSTVLPTEHLGNTDNELIHIPTQTETTQASTQVFIQKENIHPTNTTILDDLTQHYTSSDEPKQYSTHTIAEQKSTLYNDEPTEEELFYQDPSATSTNVQQKEPLQLSRDEFDSALTNVEKLLAEQKTLFPLLNELFTDEKRNLFAFIAYYHAYSITKQQGQFDILQHAHSIMQIYQRLEQEFAQETRFVSLLTLAKNSITALENPNALSTDTRTLLYAIDRYQHFLPNFPALLIEMYEIALIATFSTQYHNAPMTNEEEIAIVFRHINIISALSLIKEIQQQKNIILFARNFATSSIEDMQQYPEYFNAYYFQILLENQLQPILELLPPQEKNSHVIFALIAQVQSAYNFHIDNENDRGKCLQYILYILSHAKKIMEENGMTTIQQAVLQLIEQRIAPE